VKSSFNMLSWSYLVPFCCHQSEVLDILSKFVLYRVEKQLGQEWQIGRIQYVSSIACTEGNTTKRLCIGRPVMMHGWYNERTCKQHNRRKAKAAWRVVWTKSR
jgi:hypothetical protein